MIISASYKTDIPTFYGEWFINRLLEGHCKMVNPYNNHPIHVSLKREDVDGIVFWTKNLGPFMDRLETVYKLGYPFIVQYTINGYPRYLESSVVNHDRSVTHMKNLSEKYGPRVAVWRYDPIVFSSDTPADFHLNRFEQLTKAMTGTTDEVTISFAQLYKKTLRNMNEASEKTGFTWNDPSDETKFNLAKELSQIAASYGMHLTMCSQGKFLQEGIEAAKCVDAQRLSDVAGTPIKAALKGNRPDCMCFASRDIGEYDTCPHGCVYCYAVMNRDLAQRRYKQHDPESEYLFAPKQPNLDESCSSEKDSLQLKML